MSSSPSSRINATSIPSITTLRNDLDYGNSRLPRSMGLYDDMRVFRKNYHTSQGTPGINFWNWKDREHQMGLTEMTEDYLEKQGNGPKYWPDEDSSPNRNKYRYSVDKPRIWRLVKQLFFRLNQQQYRNNKYKHKDRIEDRGDSADAPIDVDSIQVTPTSPSKRAPAIPTIKIKSTETRPASASRQNNTAKANTTSDPMPSDSNSSRDPYAGPDSEPPQPPPIRSFEAINRAAGAKRNSQHMSATAPKHQSKRQKKIATSSSAKKNAPPPKLTAAQIDQIASFSPRKRRRVEREDFVGLEDINAAIADGEHASSTAESPPAPTDSGLRATVEDVLDEADEILQCAASPPPPPPPADPQVPVQGDEGAAPQSISNDKAQTTPSFDTSNARFEPMFTPSSVAGSSKDDDHQSEQPKPHAAPLSTTATPAAEAAADNKSTKKPSVTFVYRVMHLLPSNEKKMVRWEPRGRFQDKTLEELIGELGFDDPADVQGLVFTIELPGLQAVERIPRGNEDGFESMKRLINRSIREWFSNRRRSGGDTGAARLEVDMFIEKLSDENKEESIKGEDIDISW